MGKEVNLRIYEYQASAKKYIKILKVVFTSILLDR